MTAMPPDAQRYLVRMRSLRPPVDLVDSVMAEVEATPQVRPWPDLRVLSAFASGAAAALFAFAILVRLATPEVGPAATPVPLDQLPSAGQVQARIPMDASDEPTFFGHGFLWLTNAAAGELIRLDPSNGSIASPLQVTGVGLQLPVALTETSIWVADARDSALVEIAPASLEERRRIPVSATITAMAAESGDLWALDAGADELLRLDLGEGRVLISVPIERATTLLVHDDAVWVGVESGSLARIDPLRGEVRGRVDVGIAARRLVADGDSILVVGSALDPVVRVDIGSMRVSGRGVPAMAAVTTEGRVWALLVSGHVVRLDPATLQPNAALALELDPSGSLVAGGGSIWTTGLDTLGDAYLLQVVSQR